MPIFAANKDAKTDTHQSWLTAKIDIAKTTSTVLSSSGQLMPRLRAMKMVECVCALSGEILGLPATVSPAAATWMTAARQTILLRSRLEKIDHCFERIGGCIRHDINWILGINGRQRRLSIYSDIGDARV